MKAIGFRAEADGVRYVVLEGDADPRAIVADGKIEVGERRNICEELRMLRTEVANVLKTFQPDRGGIRLSDTPQHMANIQSSFTRARIEGVVLLVAGEFGMALKAGAAGTMKSGMKTKTSLRDYAKADELRGIDLTIRGRKSVEYRDAVIAALAALGV